MANKLLEAQRLRDENKTYEQIGNELGISKVAAWRMLNNEKRRISAELEAERTARAKESEERVNVIDIMEGIVKKSVETMDSCDPRMIQAVSAAVRLLAQLRGELVEKRENRNENHEVKDIDGGYFEGLLERFSQMADADRGKTYPQESNVNPGATESVLVESDGGNGNGN